jgi:hypothetical protein
VEKVEQAAAVLTLVMGLLLMREGLSYLERSRPARTPADYFAIVLTGPSGSQKSALAEFLKRRYALRTVTGDDLKRPLTRGHDTGFLLTDYPAGTGEAGYLAALARQPDLPSPVFIDLADRRLNHPPSDAYLIQSYYPDAPIWTLDGTRPAESLSATLQMLLDTAAPKQ